jgi:peptidoglycan lytic transglycosylase
LRNQNKCRSIKAALLTVALTGVFATGVNVIPSLARSSSPAAEAPSPAAEAPTRTGEASFGPAYARGSHAHLRRATHLGRVRHGSAQLTYFHRNGKLHLVNTDHNGGLRGIASVYHDRITANGEHMNANAMTAAHKSLPMGSLVTVHNQRNGRAVTVRINDRGPYVTGRVIDLSPGAARVLGVDGLAPVSLTVNGRVGHHV